MVQIRVVIHAHSTWSYDGRWSLKALARLFGALGADAVLMTEHDTGFDGQRFEQYRAECAAASTPGCKLIPGIEYSSPDNNIHILTFGLDHFLGEGRPTENTLRQIKKLGGAAILAHPKRRDIWQEFQMEWVEFLDGIELWNRKTDGLCPGIEAVELINSTNLPPITGVDFHSWKQIYPLDNVVIWDKSQSLEHAIVDQIKAHKLVPCAFRHPLVQTADCADKNNSFRYHRAAESVRQTIKSMLGRGRRR